MISIHQTWLDHLNNIYTNIKTLLIDKLNFNIATMDQINSSIKNAGLGLKTPKMFIYSSQIQNLRKNLDDALSLFRLKIEGKEIYNFKKYNNHKIRNNQDKMEIEFMNNNNNNHDNR